MNTIDWDGLRYFLAAAEAGSLSAAAKALNTHQPTVGRQIDTLESSLGIKLFQRSVSGLKITNEGKQFYELASNIRSSLTGIQHSLDSNPIHGEVRLALPEGICNQLIIPQLQRLYKQYPSLQLRIISSIASSDLLRGDADIAIRLYRPTESDLITKRIGTMKLALFASSQYCDSFGLPNNITDLFNHKVILYGDSLTQLEENQWLLKHTNLDNHIVSTDSTEARLLSTIEGTGISILPDVFRKKYKDLIQCLDDVTLPAHDIWLVYHKDLKNSSRINAVKDFLLEALTCFRDECSERN